MFCYEMNAKKEKSTKFDFHLRNLKNLDNDWKLLQSVPNFPYSNSEQFYTRSDESGWWMAIKQTGIRGYINVYLTILGKMKGMSLLFIDPLSSYGLNRVTKDEGRDQFIFPGTSINAGLISTRKPKGFDGIFINDFDTSKREVLNQRLAAVKKKFNQLFTVNVNLEIKQIDSNDWLIDVLRRIEEDFDYYNYLLVIDNEGMDIHYDTIKAIREIHKFGDIIINFQDAGIARAIPVTDPKKTERFFGCKVPIGTKRVDLCEIYCNQLRHIGLGKIQKMRVASATGFYYTLLFCCREDVSGDWLKLVKYYNDDRFKNFTDRDIKLMWDILKGKQSSLSKWI